MLLNLHNTMPMACTKKQQHLATVVPAPACIKNNYIAINDHTATEALKNVRSTPPETLLRPLLIILISSLYKF